MSSFRAALIGTGAIARSHATALQRETDVELVAAADIRPEAVATFGETYGIAHLYTDVESLLREQHPDLVHICTPPHTHCELSVQCLEAGAWVLCEKPLAGSLAELDVIEAAEARSGTYCSSVYQWRFGNGAQHLKTLIDRGELGRPLLGTCQITWYRDDAYYAVPWRGSWQSELGGCTMIHGIHAIDLLLWLYGPWREVSAKIGTLDHDIEVEDVSLALIAFENGALATITNSVVSPRQRSTLRFDFQAATVELEHLYNYRNEDWRYTLPESSQRTADLARWQDLPPETGRSLLGNQVAQLLAAKRRGERPPTSGEGARRALEFIASLYKSAMTGQIVERGSIRPGDPFYEAMNGLGSDGESVA
ncbi:MAG: Gfo/Idh/MocA family oxidoreductase [Trueperaceae bacterium]|nr:MAG: Gfo/Idh/MocA family oxidoreductase [Trueperaceae bacterium]